MGTLLLQLRSGPDDWKGSVASLCFLRRLWLSLSASLVSAVYDTVNRVHDEGQQNIGVSRCSDAKHTQLLNCHPHIALDRFPQNVRKPSQPGSPDDVHKWHDGLSKGVTHTQFQVWTNASRAISTCGLYSQDVGCMQRRCFML